MHYPFDKTPKGFNIIFFIHYFGFHFFAFSRQFLFQFLVQQRKKRGPDFASPPFDLPYNFKRFFKPAKGLADYF